MDFDWDDVKVNINFRKHGIRFSEAVSVWKDPKALEICDPEHSRSEERWIILGLSQHLQILTVVYVEKIENKKIRIISARKATRSEQRDYQSQFTLLFRKR